MRRVALLSSEPIRASMGGIGVRYVEMTRYLASRGWDVRLFSPAGIETAAGSGLEPQLLARYESATARRDLAEQQVVVGQGQLVNELLSLDLPAATVVDLYDPWLIENLRYFRSLGPDVFRNDHRSWLLQLGRGDRFLCASAEQRLFYLGFLTALGRIDPPAVANDPQLRDWIAVVPFGSDPTRTEGPPLLRARRPGERRLLFGGIYDWYDTDTLASALARLAGIDWTLVVVRSPNPQSTPQDRFEAFAADCRARGWWGSRVEAVDWVPAARRFDLLAEVDLLVAPHEASFETELSFRTRFLDALASGCPAVATAGGSLSRSIASEGAGWVVPAGEPRALAEALLEVLAGGAEVAARIERGRRLAMRFTWQRALAPLDDLLLRPRRAPVRPRVEMTPTDELPAEGPLARWLRRGRRRWARRSRR